MKPRSGFWLLMLFVLVLSTFEHTFAQNQEREQVVIGFVFPLTGPMSSFGEDIAKALPLLEESFNSEQSKYRFKLLLEDGKFGQSNAAIAAAKKLVEVDGARFLVIGSSGEMLQIAPYAESSQVLSVTGFSSHPAIRNSGDYVFRTYIDAGRGIELVIDDLKAQGIQRAALFTEESSFSSAIRDALQKGLGDKIIFSESFSPGEADFKTLIAKARSKNPQVCYLNTTAPSTFISLFRQLRENQVDAPFYTYYVPSLKEVQKNLGKALEGTVYLDYPEGLESSQEFKNFLSAFEKRNGKVVNAPFNFKTNYNAARVVFDAIMSVGPDARAAKDFLYKYDRSSATGRLRFDGNGDVLDLNLVLKKY